jgi:hypothetical protein
VPAGTCHDDLALEAAACRIELGRFRSRRSTGVLNYVTPDVVRKAVREVRTGRACALACRSTIRVAMCSTRADIRRLRPTERDGRLV